MRWPGTVIEAKFIKRYKRFFADFEMENGDVVTAHCANTGSMKTCLLEGAQSWITHHQDPKRKLAYSWQAIHMEDGWVGIHTGLANRLVAEAIAAGRIPELAGYGDLARERKYGTNSRIDLFLSDPDKPDCYVEVKNVTLWLESGVVGFPDAVTTRGQKHLKELIGVREQGHRAVLCYCVQRAGASLMKPAEAFDPEYATLLKKAVAAGVEVLAYKAHMTPQEIYLAEAIPTDL